MLNTVPRHLKQKLKKLVLIIVSLYVMISASLYFIQERLLFLPTVLEKDYKFSFNYNFEEINLEATDGAKLNALHFKVENPKGVILYFHGNSGDLSRWGTVAEFFVEKQYNVLIMDYRTYGKSKGKLNQDVFYEDAEMFYSYLKSQYKESQIAVYGRSLGTGIATYVASRNNPSKLVLETPYYSIEDVAQSRFPMFPVRLFLKYKFPTYQFIGSVTCPITMFHGTEDIIIPYRSAQKFYEEAPKDFTEFVKIESGNHNNLSNFSLYQHHIKILFP
ncbi:alpha/beta hydrolase [uncultured Algibacter sp.]|uniref:alpha/beta hydrolase n=1 Tax=uncultured Algibacter sp. TaxID=298659 RepID=UPI00261659D3|nr:alpha/beta hydrolase [uncultured Algibacter sp.]